MQEAQYGLHLTRECDPPPVVMVDPPGPSTREAVRDYEYAGGPLHLLYIQEWRLHGEKRRTYRSRESARPQPAGALSPLHAGLWGWARACRPSGECGMYMHGSVVVCIEHAIASIVVLVVLGLMGLAESRWYHGYTLHGPHGPGGPSS